MMKKLLLATLAVLAPMVASAQPRPPPIPANTLPLFQTITSTDTVMFISGYTGPGTGIWGLIPASKVGTGGIVVPTAPLLGGQGNALRGITLGTNLALVGTVLNATGGTVPPGPSTLGGVYSSNAPTHQFANGVDTAGNVLYAQPAFGDVSGLTPANIGALAVANNLSDVGSAATARTNLGLGTAATRPASALTGNLAAISGAVTAGHVAVFADASGTILDGGTGSGGLPDPGSNGIVARIGTNTTFARSIFPISSQIVVTNGDGSDNIGIDIGNINAANITSGVMSPIRISSAGASTGNAVIWNGSSVVWGVAGGGTNVPAAAVITSLPNTNAYTVVLNTQGSGGTTQQMTLDNFMAALIQPPSSLASAGAITDTNLMMISQDGTAWVTATPLQFITYFNANLTLPLSRLASQANNTVVGNVSGSTGTPSALTQTQLTALCNSFTSSLSGCVPASGGGTTSFLRADGSWASPPGASTITGLTISGTIALTDYLGASVGGLDRKVLVSTLVTAVAQNAGALSAGSAMAAGDKILATQDGTNTVTITGTQMVTFFNANLTLPLSRLATQANNTVVGNVSGSGAAPIALTATQLTTLCNVATSSLSGCVPASGGGTSNFLRADLSWATPSGSGNVSSSITSTNGEFAAYSGTSGTVLTNSFFAVSGPATSTKTYTLPNSNATILTSAAAVTVAQGGTGQTSYTDGQLLIGNSSGNTLTKTTLTAGSNITITNGNGSITIASSGSGSSPTVRLYTSAGTTTGEAVSSFKTGNFCLIGPGGGGGGGLVMTSGQSGSGGSGGGGGSFRCWSATFGASTGQIPTSATYDVVVPAGGAGGAVGSQGAAASADTTVTWSTGNIWTAWRGGLGWAAQVSAVGFSGGGAGIGGAGGNATSSGAGPAGSVGGNAGASSSTAPAMAIAVGSGAGGGGTGNTGTAGAGGAAAMGGAGGGGGGGCSAGTSKAGAAGGATLSTAGGAGSAAGTSGTVAAGGNGSSYEQQAGSGGGGGGSATTGTSGAGGVGGFGAGGGGGGASCNSGTAAAGGNGGTGFVIGVLL